MPAPTARCRVGRPDRLSPSPPFPFYLRRGGSLFHRQQIFGHSTLDMTRRRYCNLLTKDLQAVRNRLSLLTR